jgi:hypothetical protein
MSLKIQIFPVYVRSQVPTAASMKMTASRYKAPCSLVQVGRLWQVLTASIIRTHRPDAEGNTHLWNVGYVYETTQCYIPEGVHHHHVAIKELGHLLARPGLTRQWPSLVPSAFWGVVFYQSG